MKIELQLFKEIIEQIKIHVLFQQKFSDFIFLEISPNFQKAGVEIGDNLIYTLLKILQQEFDPENREEDLFYWYIFEKTPKIIYECDDSEINVEDVEDFYIYCDRLRSSYTTADKSQP